MSEWASGYVYSEMNASSLTFSIGQYPGKGKNGTDYTISQALVYKKSATEQATARFVFRIHLKSGAVSAALASIDYTEPTGILAVSPDRQQAQSNIYDLSGRKVETPSHHGIYIVNGKKVVL